MSGASRTKPAVFLDRDGVINRSIVHDNKPFAPTTVDQLAILPGVDDACRRLRQAGYTLVVVTNQPDLSRGGLGSAVLQEMHDLLSARLPLEAFYVCPHDDIDRCPCRKPAPGLLLRAARELDLDLDRSFLVGDRWRDIEAGRSAGCRTILIDWGYDEPRRAPDLTVSSLAEAADWIVRSPATGRDKMASQDSVRIKVFADGADVESILQLAADPRIAGFTTNPTLMHSAGVSDYEGFARKVLGHVTDRPISFEVFSDDWGEMERQARRIAGWAQNVYVKIPVTNTQGESSAPLVKHLSSDGISLNVTAILSLRQVETVVEAMAGAGAGIVSVFAGRIADTGIDPVPVMSEALTILQAHPALELLWASPREVLNIVQADRIGCHIVTVTPDILKKLPMLGRDLDQLSLDTVRMFRDDAVAAGFFL